MAIEKRPAVRTRLLLLLLCLSSVCIQGCGLGWLYMRIGDSHRIRGSKILEYDTTEKRFKNAQDAYRRAIEYYRDSLLYDQVGNPDVYHKFGYTFLQLSAPDLDGAKGQFEAGLKFKREKADKESRTDSLNSTTDEDYSQMNSGMGTVLFWSAIATKKEEVLEEALKYYAVAEATTGHPLAKTGGFMDKVLDWLNLLEQLTPVPPRTLTARVHLYRARKMQERGHPDRAKTDLAQAKEAIEDTYVSYPNDPRAKAEEANLQYLKGEFESCVKLLNELEGKRAYADTVENQILKGRALVELNKPDEAISIFTEIHDRFVMLSATPDTPEAPDAHKGLKETIKKRDANIKETQEQSNLKAAESAEKDPVNIKALVGRAHAYAVKGDLQSCKSDIEAFLLLDPQDPRLYLDAGKCMMKLKNYESAVTRLLRGYYIDPKDITINYWLGKAYMESGKKAEMRDCFSRLFQLDPTSEFAKEVSSFLK
ncbi:MAG: hypothetical protein HY814_07400 [Candidatus Riflebacteria bacterium]|nr:hypothetical protein [Candidatus Riflebacteria bacterium]